MARLRKLISKDTVKIIQSFYLNALWVSTAPQFGIFVVPEILKLEVLNKRIRRQEIIRFMFKDFSSSYSQLLAIDKVKNKPLHDVQLHNILIVLHKSLLLKKLF